MPETKANAITAQTNQISDTPVDAWPISVLKEDIHYYMEDGFMVFTEAYHLARGRCCGNTCRHCPFEHINVKP